MAVVWMEGFDFNAETGDNLQGARDLSANVGGLNRAFFYEPGYLTGQAFYSATITELSASNFGNLSGPANQLPNPMTEIRMYFCSRTQDNSTTGLLHTEPIIAIRNDGADSANGDCLAFSMDNARRLYLVRGNYFGGSGYIPLDGFPDFGVGRPVHNDNWAEFELYANYTTGECWVKRNGTQILAGTMPIQMRRNPGQLGFKVGQVTAVDAPLIDHWVVTDGEVLLPDRVYAVAPYCSMDRYETVSGGFRGVLVADDQLYRTAGTSVAATSIPNPSFPNAWTNNSQRSMYFPFFKHPVTGADWTDETIADLQGWGICTWNMESPLNAGNSVRVSTLGLAFVETKTTASGHPIIKVQPPDGLTYYSGNWVKSHPAIALNAHLNEYPRPALRADDKWLTIDNVGCLLFGPTPEPFFGQIGITFAEEYRTDMYDWVYALGRNIDYESFVITGYSVLAEGNKDFQSNYVTINYENTSPGGAYFQGIWDYAVDPNSVRWSTKQQVYSAAGLFKNQMRRLKVRGRGKALQFKVSSETGKQFIINGWTTSASSNTQV